jgi:hypothetical protein
MHILAQVLNDPDAADWVRWLNWGTWLTLAACVVATLTGGATLAITTNTQHQRWGRHLIIAGLTGTLATALLSQLINWSYNLVIHP